MPKKNKFLLVSLQEDKAKELAQVISNSTSRKILDYLSEHDNATETQLAKSLEIPLPTVHYNLKHLVKGGLVKIDEFHYSAKGKEVNHYSLANQYIIIAPRTTHGFKEKLKSILPVGILALGVTAFLQFIANKLPMSSSVKETVFSETVPLPGIGGSADVVSSSVSSAPSIANEVSQKVAESASSVDADTMYRAASSVAEPMMQGVQDEIASEVAQETLRQAMSDSADEGVRTLAHETTQEVMKESSRTAVEESARIMTKETVVQQVITEPSVWHNIALWFFIGAAFAVIVYLIVDAVRKK